MSDIIKNIKELGFPWVTQDPFLFCVYHQDDFPKGNEELAPAVSLAGRNLGQDISGKDGWNMYHGTRLPGFPAHPHRGFETVTVANKGWVDHADSMGGAGRYGEGDVQWMTAGKGLQHSEMMPLLNRETENPLDLFQIWLNLPRKNKMVEPHYKMLWNEQIPVFSKEGVSVKIVAGVIDGQHAVSPTPDSWAQDANNEVAIWLIELDANKEWQLPACSEGINRSLYFYEGTAVTVDGESINNHCVMELESGSLHIKSDAQKVRLLLLQGRPINEPVVQYGPFVMNSQQEIKQAIADYQEDQFGGWSWQGLDPDHGAKRRRFARFHDGSEETP